MSATSIHPVVAPSLTPDGYNVNPDDDAAFLVVAPSLTPDGYNRIFWIKMSLLVVAPSLTPDGYNILPRTPHSALPVAVFGAIFLF